MANLDLKLFWNAVSYFKSLFWKNKKVYYINSNKKKYSNKEIYMNVELDNSYKFINHQVIKSKYKKFFFLTQKICLKSILINDTSSIVYSGFVSTPLSIYDGFILGDNRKYQFYDMNSTNDSKYKIEYTKNKNDVDLDNIEIKNGCTDVCLIVNGNFKVEKKTCKNYPIFEINLDKTDEVSLENMQNAYNIIFSYMNKFKENNVERVHLYCSTKQPLSFIIGTAIQTYHPSVIAYEYEYGKFTWGINLSNNKLEECNND